MLAERRKRTSVKSTGMTESGRGAIVTPVKDLKEKTIRGAAARVCAQALNFMLRLGSLMILARLLGPKEFGLVGMVTAFIGVLGLFRDFGLSSAAVQRATISDEQMSTLFWINTLAGALLGLLTAAIAPVVVAFYHEPRLFWVTVVLATGFFINAAGVQHGALLQREMRFVALAVINTIALIVGNVIGIGGALAGYGYWALVAMTIAVPIATTIGVCLTAAWVPGLPRRGVGTASIIRFGGTLTVTGLVVYIAGNCEKVLLGRYWGADVLGIYGRAYQLVNIPTENLNSAAGEVAFAALSRLQGDPIRFRSYFLKGYSLVLALTLPITTACALFADDIILVLLGPKWKDATAIFRLLAPTILVFAIVNPLGWLMSSLGLVARNLKMGLVIAPLMIVSCVIGLPYGPRGVAFAYSVVMLLWAGPAVVWAVYGSPISFRDIRSTVKWPFASSIVSGTLAVGVRLAYGQYLPPFQRLLLESAIVFVAYAGVLLFVGGQRAFYLQLFRDLRRPSVESQTFASA
jgi:O-antigen/teichoic acid export membrane protein